MPAIYDHKYTVQATDIDEAGHANNLEVLRWALDAAVAHSTAQGYSQPRYLEMRVGWFVRSHEIRYHRPAMEGDALIVRTWVANQKGFRSLRRFEVLRLPEETLLARGATDWVFVSLDTGMPQPIPPEVAEAYIIVPD